MKDLIIKISEIYVRYGIKSITMDDLSNELGISKKTLYQHFKDKRDIVEKVIHHLIETQKCGISDMVSTPHTNAIDQLLMMTNFFTQHLKNYNPSLAYDLQKFYQDVWNKVVDFKRDEIYRYIMDNVHSGIEEGLYRSDLNYEIIARVYMSRLEMYQTDLWQPLEKYDLKEVFYTLFLYHVRGIASVKGLRYLEENASQWN